MPTARVTRAKERIARAAEKPNWMLFDNLDTVSCLIVEWFGQHSDHEEIYEAFEKIRHKKPDVFKTLYDKMNECLDGRLTEFVTPTRTCGRSPSGSPGWPG